HDALPTSTVRAGAGRAAGRTGALTHHVQLRVDATAGHASVHDGHQLVAERGKRPLQRTVLATRQRGDRATERPALLMRRPHLLEQLPACLLTGELSLDPAIQLVVRALVARQVSRQRWDRAADQPARR